jgi:hypothetical protein
VAAKLYQGMAGDGFGNAICKPVPIDRKRTTGWDGRLSSRRNDE